VNPKFGGKLSSRRTRAAAGAAGTAWSVDTATVRGHDRAFESRSAAAAGRPACPPAPGAGAKALCEPLHQMATARRSPPRALRTSWGGARGIGAVEMVELAGAQPRRLCACT